MDDGDCLIYRSIGKETSKVTRILSLSTCALPIISVKWLEFLTWKLVCPAKGDMRDVMCFDSW